MSACYESLSPECRRQGHSRDNLRNCSRLRVPRSNSGYCSWLCSDWREAVEHTDVQYTLHSMTDSDAHTHTHTHTAVHHKSHTSPRRATPQSTITSMAIPATSEGIQFLAIYHLYRYSQRLPRMSALSTEAAVQYRSSSPFTAQCCLHDRYESRTYSIL